MQRAATVIVVALLTTTVACGEQKSAISDSMPKPTKSLQELKQKASDMTPEELAEARRKAGFKSRDEIAAENAATFEKSAREYVKTRMKEYRALLADLRGALDGLEKWAKGKAPDAAFEKFATDYQEGVKELTEQYDKLTARGAEGGNTQAVLGKSFRTWEDLNNELAPELAKQARLATTIAEIRKGYDEVEKKLDEIEKDDTLVVNKFYKDEKADAKDDG
jgi:soluble cytochrome b562